LATIDILIGIALGWGLYSGFRQGLFLSLMSIVGFFIALFVAFKMMNWGAGLLVDKVEGLSFLVPFLAFVLIFLAVFFTLKIVAKMIKGILQLTGLGIFDRISGAALGFFKACLSISFIYWAFQSFENYTGMASVFSSSSLIGSIEPLASSFVDLFEYMTPLIKDTVGHLTQLLEPISDAPTDR
jgi:membrane protein required for colicin V production